MSGYSPLQVGDAPSPKVPLQGQSLCPVCVAEILNTLQRPVQLPCQAISPAISWPICRNSAIATASLPGAHIYFVFSDRRSQNGPLVGHPPSSRTPPGGYERVTPLLPPPPSHPPSPLYHFRYPRALSPISRPPGHRYSLPAALLAFCAQKVFRPSWMPRITAVSFSPVRAQADKP